MPELEAASWSAFSCCSGTRVAVRSSLLTLAKATAMPGSSTSHSWTKMTPCSSPLSLHSAIATRARDFSDGGGSAADDDHGVIFVQVCRIYKSFRLR